MHEQLLPFAQRGLHKNSEKSRLMSKRKITIKAEIYFEIKSCCVELTVEESRHCMPKPVSPRFIFDASWGIGGTLDGNSSVMREKT
jgi:hypothetical protein